MTEFNPVDLATKWAQELKLAKRDDEKWIKRGKKVIRRYRDERTGWSDNAKKYNILWSNVQTILPALYGKTPKAQVERRYKDQDPVGRTASQILERALQFELDHKGDFDNSIRCAITDRLLPGRGVCWVRFESAEEIQTTEGPRQYECTPVDYVYWEDYRHSSARTWDEVTWVARRVYMSKQDVVSRFGEEFSDVALTHEPIGLDEMVRNGEDVEGLRKAQIWEIWDKLSKTVTWVAEAYPKALDHKEDPYGLDGFWPCPKPLFSTQTTDTIVPIPDFTLYQDQADEIDMLTQRINLLVKALKVVGVYDASQTGVQRMLSDGVENTLIPVDTWAAFSEKGGIKGVVDFLPLDSVVLALQQCYLARDQAKQVIYEVTGLSDIIRGASIASETATAQQIKSQYASLRLKDIQRSIAVFASEILRTKAQLMCDFYAPETLIEMSGIMGTQDAQFAEQAMMMLKSEPGRNYRIEIASDSLIEMDEQTEKQSRMEFLQATGAFMEKALPVAMQVPEMGPLMAEMLLFGVRAFKGGRPMEAAFDTAMAQLTAPKPPTPPQPDPEQIKAQEQEQTRREQAQADVQKESVKAAERVEMERIRREFDERMQERDERVQKYKIDQDNATKLEIADMNARASEKPMITLDVEGKEHFDAMGEEVKSIANQSMASFGAQNQAMAQAVEMLANAVTQMNKPKRRTVERGPDGRAIGVIEVSEE